MRMGCARFATDISAPDAPLDNTKDTRGAIELEDSWVSSERRRQPQLTAHLSSPVTQEYTFASNTDMAMFTVEIDGSKVNGGT